MPTYIEDLTGALSVNRIQNEVHPVNSVVISAHKTIVPDYAPFFADGFVMHHISTGGVVTPMVDGVDYALSMEFNSASNSLGLMVYGGVTLLDNRVDGNYRLTSYQTIGGNWVADPVQVLAMLTSYAYNPRVVFYEQIVNLPVAFPPDLHTNHTSDVSRVGDIIEVLNNIATQLADGNNLTNHATSPSPHIEARLTDEQRNILKLALQNNVYNTLEEAIKSKLVDADDIVNISSYIVSTLGSAVSGDISGHNTSAGSHIDIRNLITSVSTALSTHNTAGSAHTALFNDKANVNSPTLTGTPSAPTPVSSDNSTRIATTAFVKSVIPASVDLSSKANIDSPTFTGTPSAPTLSNTNNSTAIATTAFVKSVLPDISTKANVNSPTFTGTPASTTPISSDNSTRIATTAFVKSVIPASVDLSTKANIDSPTFTGTPSAPTPDVSNESTRIATTSYVKQLNKMTGYVLPSGAVDALDIVVTDGFKDAIHKLDTGIRRQLYTDINLSVQNAITMSVSGSNSTGVFKPYKNNTFLIMWGRFSFPSADASVWVSFPSTFPNKCVSIMTTGVGDYRNYDGGTQMPANVTKSPDPFGFTAYGDSAAQDHAYIAIGY